MEGYQKVYRNFLAKMGVLPKDIDHFVEISSFHKMTTPHVLVDVDQSVDRIYITVEGDCSYRFFDSSIFLSQTHMQHTSPNMIGGFAIITGSKNYPYQVSLSKGTYFEIKLSDVRESSQDAIQLLCRAASTELLYSTSKGLMNLRDSQVRNANSFLVTMVVLSLYICFFRVESYFSSPLISSLGMSIYLLIASLLCLLLPRYNKRPYKYFGCTIDKWKASIRDAALFAMPLCLLMILVKALLTVIPNPYVYGDSIFGFYNLYGSSFLGVATLYSIFCVAQEFVARGVILTYCRQIFLETDSQKTPWRSIILTNVLFGLFHIHHSANFVIIAFCLGVYWSLLYLRTNNLIGVILNHIAVSLFGLFVLGYIKFLIFV